MIYNDSISAIVPLLFLQFQLVQRSSQGLFGAQPWACYERPRKARPDPGQREREVEKQ